MLAETGMKDFKKINWLPVSKRLNQYFCSNALKFFKEACSLYFHDVHQANTRFYVLKLKHSLRSVLFKKVYPI